MTAAFSIRPVDSALAEAVRAKIDGKTKPLGALGRLEALASQIARIQATLSPRLTAPHLLLFAGDHGAAREGISAYPQDVTWQMVLNFLGGGAAINVFTRQAGIAVRIVDAGVNHDFGAPAGLIDAKIGFGTGNFIREPAMSSAQCDAAIARGAAILRETRDLGANVMGCGEMGIGNTGSAALLVHRLTGIPLADCIGRGTGLDDSGLARKRALLAEASARCPQALGPREILAEYGGFEIAMMVGAFLAGAEARMILIVDGFIATAALIVAMAIEPAVRDYAVFAHGSAEQGHRRALDHLAATPLLDLGLRLGEGTGVPLAYPLVQAAVNFLNEMASFAEAGVAAKSEA